jgi:hypothetical protein
MDRMSTIMVKLECKGQKPLPGVSNVEVVYDTSLETTTRAAHDDSLLEGLRLSTLKQDGHGGLYGSGHRSVIPYVQGERVVLLCVCGTIQG